MPQAPALSANLPAILYFGNDWFAENRTSSHQVARCLARRYPLYYIECPGLRAPKGSGRDLLKIWRKFRRFLQGATQVPLSPTALPRGERSRGEGIKVLTLLQIPLHRFALVRWFNRLLILWTLRRLIRKEKLHRPILWFLIPHLDQVIGQLGERLSVYYCIDDYAALPDVNPEAVRRMDAATTRKADLVFVASDTLLEGKRQLNPNTHHSPHGVDFAHFARAQDASLAIPADTAGLPRPVVGFFGLFERWIALDLVDYLAAQRPQWTFLMIGRVAVPEATVPRRPNIHWVGRRPYESLPAYGKQFDAAIIPYHLTQQVLHSNPIKLREYLAMGKPIVSVSCPEIDRYGDVVAIARSPEEFLAKLDQALSRPPTPEEVRRRMDRVRAEGWEARLDGVLQTVQLALASRGDEPANGTISARRPMASTVRNPPP